MSDTYYGFLIFLIHDYDWHLPDVDKATGRAAALAWVKEHSLDHELRAHRIWYNADNPAEDATAVGHLMWMTPEAAVMTRMRFPDMRFVESPHKDVNPVVMLFQ